MVAIIERALFVIMSSGVSWRSKLAETLMLNGYKPSKADADVYMKRDSKLHVYPYYKYMLCYVDDLLHICFNPKEDMYMLNMIYWVKKGFGPPNRYLCANVEKVQLMYGKVL